MVLLPPMQVLLFLMNPNGNKIEKRYYTFACFVLNLALNINFDKYL